jgi:hypothetical protein
MSFLYSILLSIGLLVALVGAIPYFLWIIISAFKRRWSKCLRLILIPSTVFIIAWLLNYPISLADDLISSRMTYGCFTLHGTPTFQYESERTWQGDGSSVVIYNLPPCVRKHFESFGSGLLCEYPIPPLERFKWKTIHWRQAPFDPALRRYIDFALPREDETDALRKDIDAALTEPTSFYAMFVFDHSGGNPGNVDLLIVDLKRSRLYYLNQNT